MINKYSELVEQVERELGWAEEALKSDGPEREQFNRGMIFAYKSIMSKVRMLDEETASV